MSEEAPLPDDNPKTKFGQAKPSTFDIPPSAILAIGEVMALGARKYGHFNWRKQRVSEAVYYNALMRHLNAWLNGNDIDAESGQPELAHVMACCAILIDAGQAGMLNHNREPETLA